MRSTTLFGAGLAAAVASAASASITGAVVVSYSVTAADFSGSVTVNVQDLYMTSNDSADVMLNVYNLTLSGTASGITYFQSLVSTTGWIPNNAGGTLFDTAALRQADSFVTIGGFGADALQVNGAGLGTGLDPSFGGQNAAAPAALAGWYNGDPPSENGQVINTAVGLGVLVGRFSYAGDFSLEGSTLEVTWNQGVGSPDVGQAAFTVTPAPGALALLGLAGVVGLRRRNG